LPDAGRTAVSYDSDPRSCSLPRFHSRSDLCAEERANLSCGVEAQHVSGHVQLHVKVLLPFSLSPAPKIRIASRREGGAFWSVETIGGALKSTRDDETED
jgi:hypothetical protein